jgi:cellulose biosynthesis protein BcsQ
MKVISVFNNKGGVGKTTLTFHLGHALAELGHRTLLMDLDPQCNLTIFGMNEEALHAIWQQEDPFVEDFKRSRDESPREQFDGLLARPRSAHFLVKPVEDGTEELDRLSPPVRLQERLDLIPGRLTLHMYEDRIATRWSDVYRGDPLAIRTVTRIRSLARQYATIYSYEFVIVDTSPSLGALNKVLISTADGFLVPCMPDMFSLYGIRNIGKSLSTWKAQFDTIFNLISDEKRTYFPAEFVSFLGFTIYNARKYTGGNNEWDLAQAHFNYAKQIPKTIRSDIPESVRAHLTKRQTEEPIGGTSIMHSHATMPGMAQKYKVPIWGVPDCERLESEDRNTISGNRRRYEETGPAYRIFATELLKRVASLGG